FFQAEDGIRDFHVTGVQTCALPIAALVWLLPVLLILGAEPGCPRPAALLCWGRTKHHSCGRLGPARGGRRLHGAWRIFRRSGTLPCRGRCMRRWAARTRWPGWWTSFTAGCTATRCWRPFSRRI